MDLGTKTICLPCPMWGGASRRRRDHQRTSSTGDAEERLKAIAGRFQVAGVVIGLLLDIDGLERPARAIDPRVVRHLAPILGLPIAFWTKRLSTAAVTRRSSRRTPPAPAARTRRQDGCGLHPSGGA